MTSLVLKCRIRTQCFGTVKTQEYNVAYAGLSEEQLQYGARDAVATLDVGLV